MKTSIEHLPEAKQAQIRAIAALLQASAPVEMVILFGSYARGDWVEDLEKGYFSDFDVLAIVATEEQTRNSTLWADLSRQAQAIAGRTPVTLIVHDFKEVNHEIRLGQYFFIDILRDGVVLYRTKRAQLATPKALLPADRLKLGMINFRYWFGSANHFWRLSGHSAGQGLCAHSAFLLHQAVERYYHAVLLTFTGYKPKTHNIEQLADETAPLHPALPGALPRAEPEDKRRFDLLKRAYIEARYNKSFKITLDELRILRDHVHDLAQRVRQACIDKLASFCGPEAVGDLPDVPAIVDTGALPEAPSFDDAAAFQAWRDALTALAFDRGEQKGFDRGKEAGKKEGFDRGKEAGLTEGEQQGELKGQRQALFTILAARGLPVDEPTRAKIEACTDPAVLRRWIALAATAATPEALFAPDPDPPAAS